MPRTLEAEQVETTRKRMCEVALDLYMKEGRKAVSFRRLAHELDISHMQPYRYFENKEDLLAGMRRECFIRLLEHIKSIDPVKTSHLQRLYTITLGIFDYLMKRPDQYRLMFSLSQPPVADFPELNNTRLELYDYLRDIVQGTIDDGQVEGDADTVLHIAWATAHGLFTLHVSNQFAHNRDLNSLLRPAMASIFAPFNVDLDKVSFQ